MVSDIGIKKGTKHNSTV